MGKTRRWLVGIVAALVLLVAAGYLAGWQFPWSAASKEVIMATTTSTRDSGLLDILIPAFEKNNKYVIKTVAVGSGAAIEMGKKGEADVLFTHAPASERPLLEDGTVISRRLVMHNDYVIVGPEEDPAGVKNAGGASASLAAIAAKGSIFVSRGDDSGTHKMEKGLWQAAGISPEGAWYHSAALSMGETLGVASEKQGYTLTDRATYLARKDTLDLTILHEGDPVLLNIYHIMEVSSTKFKTVNKRGAKAWADWLLSAEAQGLIGAYGVDKYGSPLFFPDGGKTEGQLTGQ